METKKIIDELIEEMKRHQDLVLKLQSTIEAYRNIDNRNPSQEPGFKKPVEKKKLSNKNIPYAKEVRILFESNQKRTYSAIEVSALILKKYDLQGDGRITKIKSAIYKTLKDQVSSGRLKGDVKGYSLDKGFPKEKLKKTVTKRINNR